MMRILYFSYLFSNFITIFSLSVPYYYNPDIHNFGNIGIGGKIHAEIGPLFTKMIEIGRASCRERV